jgi:hypothetical protein
MVHLHLHLPSVISRPGFAASPFSVEALSFIFGDSALGMAGATAGDVGKDKGELDTNGTSARRADDAKMRAKAYIDKTFGLAFYVPPPILSNWRSYLLGCLEEAFVEHDASALGAVRDVYDFGRTGTGFVTPRDIKLFVNSLVGLYRQRGEDVPLTMMASYLLHREEICGTDIPDDLVTPRERRAVGAADWLANMAALHFGVPLKEGEQLLLYEPVVWALRERPPEPEPTATTAPTSPQDTLLDTLYGLQRAIDGRDWDTIRATFTPDATGYGRTGVDDILTIMQDHLGGCGPTQHLLGNPLVTVAGDRATTRAYARVHHQGAGSHEGDHYEALGEYDDRWVLLDGEWRLAYRHFDTRIHLGDFSVLQPAPA